MSSVFAQGQDNQDISHKSTLKSVVAIYNSSSFQEGDNKSGVSGSGVIVNNDGLIVTNYHVVKDMDGIVAIDHDGSIYSVDIIINDKLLDLSLLLIKDLKGNKVTPAIFGDSDKVEIGDRIYAAGNQFGIGSSLSSGVVSSLSLRNKVFSYMGNYIQIDASVNPGSSGGAVMNQEGEIIGITSLIYGISSDFSGVAFAIPSNVVKLFVSRSSQGKKISEKWIGLIANPVNYQVAQSSGLNKIHGVLVTDVYSNGPAFKAGIQKGDILLKFHGHYVDSVAQLFYEVASTGDNELIEVTYWRGGREAIAMVKPGSPYGNDLMYKFTPVSGALSGIVFVDSSVGVAYELGFNYNFKGVVVYDIMEAKKSMKQNFAEGDIIKAINDKPIKSVAELESLLSRNPIIKSISVSRKDIDFTLNVNY